jgi:endonuclease/exonuclease/phosphatase family metal-dependent hydrolase
LWNRAAKKLFLSSAIAEKYIACGREATKNSGEGGDVSMGKRAAICVSAIAVSIVGGCFEQQHKSASSIVRFSADRADIIKVMSFNIRVDTFLDGPNRWNSRKQIVFDTLADNAPDVVGLQEAMDHQVRQIQQALPQYGNYAVGRNDGKQKGESCAIFYRKDRFDLDDYGTFWFSDTPAQPGSKDWGNLWPRICTWARLVDKDTGTGFYVYNVHLDVFSQNSREKSAEMLARRVASRKTADPFIVVGDFNMGLDNPAMQYLQNAESQTPYPRMVDAWQSVHPGRPAGGTRHGFRGGTAGPQIDHIPVGEGAHALQARIDRRHVNGRYPSDHFPVIAEILLTGSAKALPPIAARPTSQQTLQN